MKWLTELAVPSWVRYLGMYLLFLVVIISVVYIIYHSGVANERERNLKIENAKIAEYGQHILELQTRNRTRELDSVMRIYNLTNDYEKRLTNANIQKNNALYDVERGTRKLRIATRNTAVQASGDSAAKISTIATPATESSAELSESAAQFLIGFASDCDATAEKLNLAIDIAKHDRAVTGAISSAEMRTSIELSNVDLTNKEIK